MPPVIVIGVGWGGGGGTSSSKLKHLFKSWECINFLLSEIYFFVGM